METQTNFSQSKWILFNCIGWVLGVIILLLISAGLESIKWEGQAAIAIGMGLGVGFMQWLVLSKQFSISLNWCWFLMIGLFIPFLAYDILARYVTLAPEWGIVPATAIGAYLSGSLQYNFILKKISEKTKSWIMYNFLGWFVTAAFLMAISLLIVMFKSERYIMAILSVLSIIFGGIILGAITGNGWKKILKEMV
ncbi:MAG: hypothetical protein WCH29_04000 [Chitinophagaceae bacterium]